MSTPSATPAVRGHSPPGAGHDAPRTVPGMALRLGAAAAVAAAIAMLVAQDPASRVTPWALLATAGLLAVLVARPGSAATTVALLLVAVLVLDTRPGWLLVPVAAAVHLAHVLAALAALGPAGTRFETTALRPTLRRYLSAQAAVLVVPAVAVLAPRGAGVPGAVEVGAALLALALVAAALVLAARRSRRPR